MELQLHSARDASACLHNLVAATWMIPYLLFLIKKNIFLYVHKKYSRSGERHEQSLITPLLIQGYPQQQITYSIRCLSRKIRCITVVVKS